MGRHRIAGREFGVLMHVEHHPILALGVFKALAQQAIGFTVNIRGHDLSADALTEQAFIHHRAQRTATTLARIGVHRIKRPEGRDRNLAAFGGVGVHIVEMGVIGGVFQIAVKGVAMRGDDLVTTLRGVILPPSGTAQHRGPENKQGRASDAQHGGLRFCVSTGMGPGHRAYPL